MKTIPAFAGILLLLVHQSFAAVDSQPTGPAAIVNGVEISITELNQELQPLLQAEAGFHRRITEGKKRELRDRALSVLVDKEILFQEALKEKLVDEDAVDRRFDEIKGKIKAQKKDFRKTLEEIGFTKKSLRRHISRTLHADKVKAVKVDDRIAVSDDDVRDYYEKNRQEFVSAERFRASHILIKIPTGAGDEVRKGLWERAGRAMARLIDGEDFAEVASEESEDSSRVEGGDIGFFSRGEVDPAFEKAAAGLDPGEISGIVETSFGLHIIKLIEKVAGTDMPTEQAMKEIRKTLEERQREKLYREWFDPIRKAAVITYPGEEQK